jgi:hypothetical protein
LIGAEAVAFDVAFCVTGAFVDVLDARAGAALRPMTLVTARPAIAAVNRRGPAMANSPWNGRCTHALGTKARIRACRDEDAQALKA